MKSKAVKGAKQDLKAAKKRIKADFNKARAKISEVEQHAENYVAKNPKKAAAIAAGVGAVIGAAIAAYWMKHKKK